jgi:menaquinone-dependent protoporphyrinogen IX oxidase
MKAIVVYTSKYGSTEQYATWIAEELGCKAEKLQNVTQEQLSNYDTIIYGGWIFASSVSGFKKFLALMNPVEQKRLVLFTVGFTSTEEKAFYDEAANKAMPLQWKERFSVFHLRGNQMYTKMSGVHKLIMKMQKSLIAKKPQSERSADDQFLIDHFGEDIIFVDKKNVAPIVNAVKQ